MAAKSTRRKARTKAEPSGSPESDKLKTEGNVFYKKGEYSEAVRLYTAAIDADSSNHIAYANRAQASMKLGAYQTAIDDCSVCTELKPKYLKAYLRRGTCRKALGLFSAALADFATAKSLSPKNTQAIAEVQSLSEMLKVKGIQPVSDRREATSKRKATVLESEMVESATMRKVKDCVSAESSGQREFECEARVFYGQFVVGPPGAGKSTYCRQMKAFLQSIGRNVCLINLDPDACHSHAQSDEESSDDEVVDERYEAFDIDICELITVSEVMRELQLGANGALVYCMEYLASKLTSWLWAAIDELGAGDWYLLFDCAGQMELFVHHSVVRRIVHNTLLRKWQMRLACVNLLDCHYSLNSTATFVSISLMSLCAMLHLEMPHVNVLSKVDIIDTLAYDCADFDWHTYFDCGLEFKRISQRMDARPKLAKLTKAMAEALDIFSLVSYVPFSATDKNTLLNVLAIADRANGFDLTATIDDFQTAQVFEHTSKDESETRPQFAWDSCKNGVQFIVGDVIEKNI